MQQDHPLPIARSVVEAGDFGDIGGDHRHGASVAAVTADLGL
jgi:hypothetical protein